MYRLLRIVYLLLILLLPVISVAISTLFFSKKKFLKNFFKWHNALFILGWWFVFSFSYTLVGRSDLFELYQLLLIYLLICLAYIIVFYKRFGKSYLLSVCFAALLLVTVVPAVQLASLPRNRLLFSAAEHNHTYILRMLLVGASQEEMNAALNVARKNGHTDVVELLKAAGAKE
jgi:hypothetical protein